MLRYIRRCYLILEECYWKPIFLNVNIHVGRLCVLPSKILIGCINPILSPAMKLTSPAVTSFERIGVVRCERATDNSTEWCNTTEVLAVVFWDVSVCRIICEVAARMKGTAYCHQLHGLRWKQLRLYNCYFHRMKLAYTRENT